MTGSKNKTWPCPLCRIPSPQGDLFHQGRRRIYLRCLECGLVFVPPPYHLAVDQERSEYDRHRNSPDDPGYRRFLGRLFGPLCRLLPPRSRGLDFGSGPGPTLSVMFAEAGHSMAIYDPFYADNPAVLADCYDFITASEVVEHLRQPGEELERLFGLLKPGGILGIMTKLVIDRAAFSHWHYKRDPTHICFFSRATFAWLARRWQAEMDMVAKDVIFFQKQA